MFDKKRGEWSHAAIKKVAQQDDYFSPELEKRLADEIETPGHAALGMLRGGRAPSATQREALVNYIAVMLMRVPRKRRKGRELVPAALRAVVTEARELISGAEARIGTERMRKLLADLERAEAKYSAEAPQEVIAKILSPWPTEEMVDAVRRMVWRFSLAAPRASRFFTSDNPACYFESYGVGSPEAELTFPISPDLALLGSHRGLSGSTKVLTLTPELTKEVNRRMAAAAERFIFSSHRAKWIETLATRRDPFLSRITW
jgi:hypothetical protein